VASRGPRPPLLGRVLLRLRRLGTRREEIEADLCELFRERAVERGRWYAAYRHCADAVSLWIYHTEGIALVAAPHRHRRDNFLDALRTDVRFAIRALRRRPAFTAAAVLTLALGIGANAAMFSVIETVILDPLPFVAPDRVVQLWDVLPNWGPGYTGQVSEANFRDYENLNEVFSDVAAQAGWNAYVEHENRVVTLVTVFLSANLFDMMGVVPIRGRTFRAEEDLAGVGNIVLLTHGYWLREFGGEEVIGRKIFLRCFAVDRDDPLEYEIVGVLPPDFRLPPTRREAGYGVGADRDVVLPLGLLRLPGGDPLDRSLRTRLAFAQLREGVTVEQARANLQSIAAGIAASEPEYEGLEVTVVPVGELPRQEYGVALGFLWAATALVLLVACASVSSLLLGWGVARERELAVRAALGAGARRIFSQLLT